MLTASKSGQTNIFSRLSLVIEDKLISFLISTSIFVAINGILEVYFSFLLFGIISNLKILLSFFLMTFFIYGLNKLTDINEDAINTPERAKLIKKNRAYF